MGEPQASDTANWALFELQGAVNALEAALKHLDTLAEHYPQFYSMAVRDEDRYHVGGATVAISKRLQTLRKVLDDAGYTGG